MTQNSKTHYTILILIPHYLPGTRSGGPVRTISNLIEILGDEFDFRVLALDHDYGEKLPYTGVQHGTWYFVGKSHVMYLRSSEQRPWALRKILVSIKYDLVLLNGVYPKNILSFLMLRRLGLIEKKPVVIAPRGHLESGALSIKPLKKRLFLAVVKLIGLFDNLNWLAASSFEEQDILREFGSRQVNRIRVVPNLANLPLSRNLNKDNPIPSKLPGRLKVVFLSRISRKKNLTYALDTLKGISGEIEFDLFGPLEDHVYWQECQEIVRSLPQNIQVCHQGKLELDAVIATLQNYHLFFLPTLGENFGHAILEALGAGCPVLISDRTPWNDVNERGAGWALPLEETDRFREVIQQMVNADADTWRAYSEGARAYGANYLATSNAVEDMRQFLIKLALEPNSKHRSVGTEIQV